MVSDQGRRIVVILTLVSFLAACGGNGGRLAGNRGSPKGPPSRPSPSPSPSVDYDALADDFAKRVQDVLDEHGGGVEITFGQVTDDLQLGKVVMVQMGDTTVGDAEAGVFTLLALAEVVNDMKDQFHDANVDGAGFRDPTGGEGIIEVADLIAYQEGGITVDQLRQRVRFDF